MGHPPRAHPTRATARVGAVSCCSAPVAAARTGVNQLDPLSTNLYPDGTALVGDKMWLVALPDNTQVKWLYSLMNTGQAVHRMLLI